MSLRFPRDLLRVVHDHAREGHPHEVVGILAGDAATNTVRAVRALVNERADSAHNRYRVSGLVLARAQDALEAEGHDILGYYHSHPDHPARWSDYDRDHALPNLSYVIVSVFADGPRDTLSWRLRDDRSVMDPETVEIVD